MQSLIHALFVNTYTGRLSTRVTLQLPSDSKFSLTHTDNYGYVFKDPLCLPCSFSDIPRQNQHSFCGIDAFWRVLDHVIGVANVVNELVRLRCMMLSCSCSAAVWILWLRFEQLNKPAT